MLLADSGPKWRINLETLYYMKQTSSSYRTGTVVGGISAGGMQTNVLATQLGTGMRMPLEISSIVWNQNSTEDIVCLLGWQEMLSIDLLVETVG